jgi:voltage-gated potassium channel
VKADAADTRTATAQGYFEKPLLVAAVLTIPATILEFSQTSGSLHALGTALNWAIWIAFLAELVVMVTIVRERGSYLLKHPLDVAIVVLTPPFLQSAVQSVRLLRLLRLFRLLRLEPLARRVFSLEGVKATASLALLTAVASGAGFATEEGISFGNGVYWAITTMTTVGYGDITPKSTEGKILAVFVMLVGIGAATLVIGAVAQRFISPSVEHVESTEDDVLIELREIAARLGRLEQRLQDERRATGPR